MRCRGVSQDLSKCADMPLNRRYLIAFERNKKDSLVHEDKITACVDRMYYYLIYMPHVILSGTLLMA